MNINDISNNFVNERRIGMFKIADRLIFDEPYIVMKALSTCIVVRAERMYAWDAVEYHAFSPGFDPQPSGVIPPEYVGEFVKKYDPEKDEEIVIFSGWKKVQP